MKTIGFFNNKGGVGKTSLVYHVAWMIARSGVRVVAADLDPQANLTSMFLSEERLEQIWDSNPRPTLQSAVAPLFDGTGVVEAPVVEQIDPNLGLLVGDLGLSRFEDDLSTSWPQCSDGIPRAFRVVGAFARAVAMGAKAFDADIALVDMGPNLGALNRAVLIGCDHIVVPLGADLFSLQGLRNMGPTLDQWRRQWAERVAKNPDARILLPAGTMTPAGYVVMRHSVRLDRPARGYEKWIARMPSQYRRHVLNDPSDEPGDVADDPNCLAQLKDYRSLMPMAQEARKPMFLLRPGDGAFGSHAVAVQDCYADFRALTDIILDRCAAGEWLDRMIENLRQAPDAHAGKVTGSR